MAHMSLLRRLTRALDTTAQLQLDHRSLFGALGEEYASRFLEGPGIVSRVTNPVLPISNGRKNPPEADFLVYTRGNLFCIEVKHYKGRITGGVDDTTILQEKTGYSSYAFQSISRISSMLNPCSLRVR
ncbi:MAG: NERD domain-containing protein [Ktedonobacteraceae bacterium]|nr:NERD domain-containing protein [Ktedonobacteraceae bacterium]